MNKLEIRYCEDIAMWAIDRKISTSCVWKTDFCDQTCYNNKLFDLYPAMHGKDDRNEKQWKDITGKQFKTTYDRKKKGDKSRFRFMTRGECFDTVESVMKVRDILVNNPDTVFWIITRAWRDAFIGDGKVLEAINEYIKPLQNARLQGSLDPSNSAEEITFLRKVLRWSTIHYGDDSRTSWNGERGFKCPKTWKHISGHCTICKGGCFNKKRNDVFLKQH